MLNKVIANWINNQEVESISEQVLRKYNPGSGQLLYKVCRSDSDDVGNAIKAAASAYSKWADMSAVRRGDYLFDIVQQLSKQQAELAEIIHLETGKSIKDSLAEIAGAIQLGKFFASEGMRLYGRTMQSAVMNKHSSVIREPLGVAGLIISANTPIANIAWKVFPALICGNTVVLKAAEDAPNTALFFAKLTAQAGLADGVLNIIQGDGPQTGQALLNHEGLDIVSFTGSSRVGQQIASMLAPRLVKLSLELGGKNPLLVCDDADLEKALHWTLASSFSNAGQRCASSSRIIVMEKVYDQFLQSLVPATENLVVGLGDDAFLGPVINRQQLENILLEIKAAKSRGASILTGGVRLQNIEYTDGYFIAPTILADLDIEDPLTNLELFGPVTAIYKAKDYYEALEIANSSRYGLTAAIHTRDLDRAYHFCRHMRAGVVNVNAGTHGSEPHFPFGGFGYSGNGSREPGLEALEVYSAAKSVSFVVDQPG